MKLPGSLQPITTFVRIDIKRLFRDRVAIFFVFIFPLIFLFVFGGLFGGTDEVSFTVGLINESDSRFSGEFANRINETEVLSVDEEVINMEISEQKLERSQIDATILLPEGFGDIGEAGYPTGQAKVIYNENNSQAAQTLTAILNGEFERINAEFVDTTKPFTAAAESTAEEGLRQFDYVFSGLLGFSLLSLGVFGPTNVFPRMKSKGILRRYHAMPLKVWQYFTGNVLSNAFIGLIAVALMFVVALTIFGLEMRGSYINLAIVAFISTMMLFGIGMSIGGWAKNENQAAPLSNLVAFPLMFLSGVFFPRFLMPEWLQNITEFIPLTPVVDAFRLIVTEGNNLLDIMPQLAIITGWGVVIYIVAFKVFRWE